MDMHRFYRGLLAGVITFLIVYTVLSSAPSSVAP